MEKASKALLKVFAVGVLLCVFAGTAAFLGYVVALMFGGEFGKELCSFIFNEYFPVVIRICSVSVGFGLIGMYLNKMKALSLISDKNVK